MIYKNKISTHTGSIIFILLLLVSASGAENLDKNAISTEQDTTENYPLQLALNANQDSSALKPDSGKNFKPTPVRVLTIAERFAALDGKYVWDKSKYYLKIKVTKGVLSLEKYTKGWRYAGRECTFPRKSHVCMTRSPVKEYTLSEFGIQKKYVVKTCVYRAGVGRVCGPVAGLGYQTIVDNYSFQNL